MSSDTRSGVHPIDAEGTPERLWREWGLLRRLPAFALTGIADAVVVAPHPDDETLGFGGGLALLAALGTRITVVAVTDGEGSHPEGCALAPMGLVAARAEERARALSMLGAGDVRVVRLGLPDGEVTRHRSLLTAHLTDLCAGAQLCVTSWAGDLHPDHRATGLATRDAVRGGVQPSRTVRGPGRPTLVSYPVWMWHWARPADESVPWERARGIDLPPGTRRRKERALGAFTTQTEPTGPSARDRPVLDEGMLAHFRRDREVVFR
ncbi:MULTISPECIES: PIG-L deacetylase family protein [unclassified Nocardiopsis]|uniref:PIG-L deacetylase family protein n=1 Tax=unclassified Nocardiopsis TaxID=2649073 RepID=UPI00066BFCBF|nr:MULTISPECIES: PIG-L family deacetylase [unclassified Nocardiopsis]MBQ1082060.1 PIG-L family deacetylase [Nocardiopsis sp. B62]